MEKGAGIFIQKEEFGLNNIVHVQAWKNLGLEFFNRLDR